MAIMGTHIMGIYGSIMGYLFIMGIMGPLWAFMGPLWAVMGPLWAVMESITSNYDHAIDRFEHIPCNL